MSNCNDSSKCCEFLSNENSSKFFKAFGDLSRLKIFNWLVSEAAPSNVKEISKCCSLDLSVVSRHLKTLKDAGILHAEKQGKEVFYSVNSEELATRLRSIADYLDNCCNKGKKNE